MADILEITTTNLCKRFNREWIFRDLTLTFSQGNTYAITGQNGSGKSTLMQVLWGQMPPTSGSLHYTNNSSLLPIEEVYQHMSIATPYMDLIDEFTLLEQLQFHFKLKKLRGDLSIEKMLNLMYLDNAKDKYISNFSSGMKQRLKLGLAFFTQANVIFLDEPGTNLDKQAFAWYVQQLQTIPSETMVFIASNDPNEYPDYAININIMDFK